jgi:hypothetical protein
MEYYGGICKEIIVVHLKKTVYYPYLFYEGLKKSYEDVNQDTKYSCMDSKQEFSELNRDPLLKFQFIITELTVSTLVTGCFLHLLNSGQFRV